MQKILSISFVVLYVLAMLRPVQPVLYYYLNQDYIAEFLCINKNRPKMHCDGKCYLIKELKKQGDEKTPQPAIQWENYPIGFVSIFSLFEEEEKDVSFFKNEHFYENHYSYLFLPSPFHPPQV